MSSLLRLSLAILLTAVPVFASQPAFAQSGDTKSGDKPAAAQPADPAKDAQRQVDEFAEATRLVTGPAGNPECVWLGRRVVGLMWRDDMDTAFRHLDLYDRFGCPGPHIQAAFRCVVRQGNNIDPKAPQSLNARVHACWLNPDRLAARRPPPPAAAPASSAFGSAKFSASTGGRWNPYQRSALAAGAIRDGHPSSIRHDVESIVLWPPPRYAAPQQWPTQGTGWRQNF